MTCSRRSAADSPELPLAESACIPVPSEVIMMFGGALAAGAVPGAHPALGYPLSPAGRRYR